MSSRRQKSDPRGLVVVGKPFSCHVCAGMSFYRQEVKLNTTGMTFFGLDWLNESADGAVCSTCGYVHLFYGELHHWA